MTLAIPAGLLVTLYLVAFCLYLVDSLNRRNRDRRFDREAREAWERLMQGRG